MKKGILISILSLLIMSLSTLINKLALTHIQPMQAALFNSIFSTIFCLIYSIIVKQKISIIRNKYIWIAGLTNSIGLVCLYKALSLLSPITVGFIGRFYIVFAVILAVVILKEKMTRSKIILIIMAIVGTFLFVEKDFSNYTMVGALLAILYTFLFAFTNTLIKKTIEACNSNTILFYNNAISSILIGLYMIVLRQNIFVSSDLNGIGFVILSAFFSGFLGLLLYYQSLKYIDFSLSNVIRSMSPIIVAIYSWPFFPIKLTTSNIIGAMLILFSVIFISRVKD